MKFGLTREFGCSYLPEQQEQLLVLVEQPQSDAHYEMLIEAGFRRSGEQIYRPHCKLCDACQSLRVDAQAFSPSRSQRRILKRNADLQIRCSREEKPEYYPLFADYIEQRHKDGSMYPPSREQFDSFVGGDWLPRLFIECHQEGKLVAVAVTDELEHAYSALYTFFDSNLQDRSIGLFLILQQLALARQFNKSWVYLGYQIDACRKMQYKANFYPHERFFDNKWHRYGKKER